MVRFADLCDVPKGSEGKKPCGNRSSEYGGWPPCEDCGDSVCDDCREPGSLRERDGRAWCLCRRCAREEELAAGDADDLA